VAEILKKVKRRKEKKDEEISFALTTKDDKEAIEGGTLEVGVVSDTDFTGIFNEAFSKITLDTYFGEPALEGLFNIDKELRYTDSKAAKIKFDTDAKTATITLNDNLKWSDGEDITADDLLFPYEVISHKDYTGVRYTDDIENIVGVSEFHEGKADTISGIEKMNDKEIVIHFKEFSPSILQGGGTIVNYAMPKHAFKGIAVKDMESSDPVRKKPVTMGPYSFNKIIPGESVEYTPNKYYYGEKPKLDKVVMSKVGTSAATEAMKAKKYDLLINMETSTYESWKDNDSYQILGDLDTAYDYLGFKLGTWDSEKGEVVTDPNAKMADKNLRQAMGYAIDNKLISDRFYNGLKIPATSLIVPAFGNLHDKEMKGYEQNMDKANTLLDEAGFKDVDNDGYREDKNGKKLTINLAFRDNAEVAKSIADYYIQEWKKAGLRVELTGGRLMEVNGFYDRLGSDDPEIDVYQGGWSTGFDPNQSGLYGSSSQFNYTRFSSDKNTELLNRMGSSESLDETKQAEIYKEWQEYAFDQSFVIPTMYMYTLVPAHNRVVGYSVERDKTTYPWATIGVTAETRD
jgi:peptide/nickel transport system substrate-binding protein